MRYAAITLVALGFLSAANQKTFSSPDEAKMEILARRIGANEINAMEVCRGYVEAQLEYATQPRNGAKVLQYAQRIDSAPGKQDGLYWEPDPREGSVKGSPIVPKAFAA